jgi:cell wall-associated NlpC family hydrolase
MMVRVIVPIAALLAEPRASASLTSQYLNGHRLDQLDERGDWLRVRGGDGYEGWMHRGYTAAAPSHTSADRISLGCVARSATGRVRALPLGALLDDDEKAVGGETVARAELAQRFPAHPDAIVESALRLYEGTSYLWGGVTPWGADCSGLVQSIYGLHGIALPRDAGDQARGGIEVPDAAASLAMADLVFFSDRPDGRITHVAIAIGGARIVHLALGRGGYAVEDFQGGDEYTAALRGRIRFARRVVG